MKKTFLIFAAIITIAAMLFVVACKKDGKLPVLTTVPVVASADMATGGGVISDDGGSPVTARGVCWDTIKNPTIEKQKTSDGTGIGAYTSTITGLYATKTYYVRAYATNEHGTAYGNEVSFTTLDPGKLPKLTTIEVSNITDISASCGGLISDDGGDVVTARGVCWSAGQTPTINDSKTTDGAGGGSFTSIITGLTEQTTYFVRAYATNRYGTAYGMTMSFTTKKSLPTLTTLEVTNISSTYAQSGGNITSEGSFPITKRGVCWSTERNPTINDAKTSDGTGTGMFDSRMTRLERATTYYVRAYATNERGTAYGNEQSFVTMATGDAINVITLEPEYYAECLILLGEISKEEASPIQSVGFCWSTTNTIPTMNDNHIEGSLIDNQNFGALLVNVEVGVTYYISAYAINESGIWYGNVVSYKVP